MSLLVDAPHLVQEVSPSRNAQKPQYGTFNPNRDYCNECYINLPLCAIAFDQESRTLLLALRDSQK